MKHLRIILVAIFLVCVFAQITVICRRVNSKIGIYPRAGTASWYSASRTVTGEIFDDNALTCAMRREEFGRYYKVCNSDNGRCVVVRHNNWGPSWKLFKEGRIIDLSKGAFLQIADLESGVIKVTVNQEPIRQNPDLSAHPR